MASYDFDLITLGAGSGGVRASRLAGGYGARVAVIEERRVGGTCVLRGCVPKKLLVYAAHVAEELEDARGFGWRIGEASHDWPALIAAKDKELDRLNAAYRHILDSNKVTTIMGRGVLVDAHTVEVAGEEGETRRLTAETILIAVGGWPALPDIPGVEHAITSNEALDLKALPKRVVIVGGGYIAVEFAGIFSALGVEVTEAIRADNILRGFDEDVRVTLSEEMVKKGIRLRPDTRFVHIEKTQGGFVLTDDKGEMVETDLVMYATGRAPNTKGLGLDRAGVEVREDGAIVVDEWSRTSVPNIYAVGDVTDRINLTPVAIAEGHALAETLFNKNPMKADHENVPSAVFSQPPVGSVGLSEETARRRYGEVDIYRTRFRPMKHTLSGRDERTMMKLVVEPKGGRVVGAHMVGPDAPEIIQGVAIAVKCGATKAQFDATVGIHPTAAEEFVTMRQKVVQPKTAAAD